jgi:crotonobetainyl-CoA:carnitine CoA-transferase CaiB-like acyl-CoA transferase
LNTCPATSTRASSRNRRSPTHLLILLCLLLELVTRPHELFDDPHLSATGALAPLTLPAGASGAGRPIQTRAPLLPLTLSSQRLPLRSAPPALGEHSRAVLHDPGYDDAQCAALIADGVLGQAPIPD